jgi:DNA ligase (NAD+)
MSNEALDEKYLYYIANNYNINLSEAGLIIDQCIKHTAAVHNLNYYQIYNTIFAEDGLKHALEHITYVQREEIKRRPDLKKKLAKEQQLAAQEMLQMFKNNFDNVKPALTNKDIDKVEKEIKRIEKEVEKEEKEVEKKVEKEEVVIDTRACNTLSVQECIESNTCAYIEPYGCVSRKIENAEVINNDPDKYIHTYLGKTEDLKRMVIIASYLYYNYDGGGLSDNAFDALQWHLNKREKIKTRAYEKIGAPVIEKLRTTLLYPLPSLNKVTPSNRELITFINIPNCYWALKLDGVSGMVIYDNYELVSINTRGDGSIGGNVTYLKDYITKGLPHKINSKYLVVRGEFVISKQNWETKYKGSFSNARAFVSGKINSGYIVSALFDIEFVAYEIMNNGTSTVPGPSVASKVLIENNFQVVDGGKFATKPTIFEIMELYKKKRLEAIYYIDGLVLSIDEERPAIEIGSKLQNPSYAVAFKMLLEEQIRATKALDVEWNISRYGKYIPVVIYEAVYIDDVRLTRATGHNAKHIQSWSMGKGTNIKVVRAGEIIPQIKDVEVDTSIEPILPDNKYTWHWDKSDIILDQIEGNREVMIKRIIHFFETIEVPRLKEKTVEKLFNEGYETPESIIKASVKDFVKVKGIGQKTGELFYNTIRSAMVNTPPDRFIEASTTFESGIGRTLLKLLFKNIPNILDLSEEEIRKYFKTHKIPGFGAKRIENVATGIPKFRDYLNSFAKSDIEQSINNYLNKIKKIKEEGYNPLISNNTFVLTNMPFTTDYELEDYIYDNNGQFADVVTSKTAAVVCGNLGTVSKKMIKAAELKVPVYFLQEFSERYHIPLKRFEK